MAHEQSIQRYRRWYRRLLRLYPKSHRERFGEGMEQTFNDLLSERDTERGLFGCAFWIFVETSAEIIRENGRFITMKHKNIIRLAVVTALILLVPFLAMQVTEEVNWSFSDFAIMGSLIFGTGLTYELVARKGGTFAYRAAVGVALAAALLLVWINAAVGIIGDEKIPTTLMYFGVLAIGIVGATIARLEPHGMTRTLIAMALAQVLVPVVALVIAKPQIMEPPGVVGVFVLNAFFAMLFIASAVLFGSAAGKRSEPRVEPTA